jgi:hypothetical protein
MIKMLSKLSSDKITLSALPKDVQREVLLSVTDNDLYNLDCTFLNDEDDYFWKKKVEIMQAILVNKYVVNMEEMNDKLWSRKIGWDKCGDDDYTYQRLYGFFRYEKYIMSFEWDCRKELKKKYGKDIFDKAKEDEDFDDYEANGNFWKQRLIELIYDKPSTLTYKEYYEHLKYRKQIIMNDWDIHSSFSETIINWNECTFVHELLNDRRFLEKYIDVRGIDRRTLLSYLHHVDWRDPDPAIDGMATLIKHGADTKHLDKITLALFKKYTAKS